MGHGLPCELSSSSGRERTADGILRGNRFAGYPMTDASPSPADLLLVNGCIATQDDRRSFVSALAIKNGRIHATGDTKTMMAHKGPATRVIELNNRTVIPGLIDSHSHPV